MAGVGALRLFAQASTQELKLTVGKSMVIDYPSDIGRISTSKSDIVDAVPITSREILINAKANGQSTLVIWSKTGERTFFEVTVDQDLEPIQKLLKENLSQRVHRSPRIARLGLAQRQGQLTGDK